MQIAIELIDTTLRNVRTVPVAAEAEAALKRSVEAHGILQAIIVRPVGNRYELVFGSRRLRAAREAGLIEIPADVRDMDDAEARAAQITENVLRQRLHPVDQWFAARTMLDAGSDLDEVATVLGLDRRGAQRMDRLGRLHPSVLKAIEQSGEMPDDRDLRMIANAPEKTQVAALKNAKQGSREGGYIGWHLVAVHCRGNSIPRALAIFDLDKAKIVWDEDLFAEPGSDEQFTTRNVEQFLKLQRAALEAQVAEAQKKKKRVHLAEFDKHLSLVIPKGWRDVWGSNPDKLRAHEHVFMAVATDGKITKRVVLDVPSEKAAEKAAAKKTKEAATRVPASAIGQGPEDVAGDVSRPLGAAAAAEPGARAGETEATDDEPIEAAGRGPLTKAGLSIVAAAKTEALRKALADDSGEPVLMLALMILAFTASNVDIRGVHRADHPHHPEDLVAKLLLPGGELDTAKLEARAVCGVAAELLGRFLTVGGPDAARHSYTASSGDAAEWIGRALGAGELLPRFDSEEFLKHVAGGELKRLAGELQMRTTMKLDALRSALVGNAPNWRPAAAQFGAAAPVVRERAQDEWNDDDDDVGKHDVSAAEDSDPAAGALDDAA